MWQTKFIVGLDLGQVRDYTAIAVLERAELIGDWDAVMYARRKSTILRVRSLERVPLGTPYPEVAELVRRTVRSGELLGNCRLVPDATGVGRPVIDMMKRADLGCSMYPVMITGGIFEKEEHGYYCVPKRDLIVGLQVMLQQGALQIPRKMDAAGELVEEMSAMQVRITPKANEQFGSWRENAHDDLVLAVALACWGAKLTWGANAFGEDGWWRRDR